MKMASSAASAATLVHPLCKKEHLVRSTVIRPCNLVLLLFSALTKSKPLQTARITMYMTVFSDTVYWCFNVELP